jgi:hypothetical protein
MKKIKHFKINFRQREILRLLKTTARLSEMTAQLEEAVMRESERLHSIVAPAAMYETQQRDKLPAEFASAGPGSSIAASLYLVTIGSGVEQEIKDAQQREENIVSQILHAIAIEALEQSNNFVLRLLADEAKEDGCELSQQQTISAPDSLTKFFEILPGDKIGVQRSGDAAFQPLYSHAGASFWLPLKKRSK